MVTDVMPRSRCAALPGRRPMADPLPHAIRNRDQGPAQDLRRGRGGARRRPSRSPPARSSACSDPTAPARRRPSRSSRATAPRSAGDVSVLGHDPERGERALRERDRHRPPGGGRAGRPDGRRGARPCTGATTRAAAPSTSCIELVGLDAKSDDARASSLSGGQRRRLDLALALVGDPDLLFLDEPTTGFDPSARRQAWSTIKDLCALGKTVFLTTHFMDEAQALADRVAVMRRRARSSPLGTPAELGGRDRRRPRSASRLPADVGARRPPRRSTARGSPTTAPAGARRTARRRARPHTRSPAGRSSAASSCAASPSPADARGRLPATHRDPGGHGR